MSSEPTQVVQIRQWVAGELHVDHESFAMSKGFAKAVIDHIDAIQKPDARNGVICERPRCGNVIANCDIETHPWCDEDGTVLCERLLIDQARSLAESLDEFRELCITRDADEQVIGFLLDAAARAWDAFAALGGDD